MDDVANTLKELAKMVRDDPAGNRVAVCERLDALAKRFGAKLCMVKRCDRRLYAKGLCNSHYHKARYEPKSEWCKGERKRENL